MNKKYFSLLLVAAFLCCTIVSCSDDILFEEEAIGRINGHDYTYLGLSVVWATCNVGANSPEEYGNYYAWGEIEPKEEYALENCTTWDKVIDDIAGNPDYDAARANWGGSWRMPTAEEIQELIDNCDWKWAKQNGVKGCLATSKINGKHLFFPATGWWTDTKFRHDGVNGYCWSSTPWTTPQGYISSSNSNFFFCNDHSFELSESQRYYGYSVRAVSD